MTESQQKKSKTLPFLKVLFIASLSGYVTLHYVSPWYYGYNFQPQRDPLLQQQLQERINALQKDLQKTRVQLLQYKGNENQEFKYELARNYKNAQEQVMYHEAPLQEFKLDVDKARFQYYLGNFEEAYHEYNLSYDDLIKAKAMNPDLESGIKEEEKVLVEEILRNASKLLAKYTENRMDNHEQAKSVIDKKLSLLGEDQAKILKTYTEYIDYCITMGHQYLKYREIDKSEKMLQTSEDYYNKILTSSYEKKYNFYGSIKINLDNLKKKISYAK